LKTRRSRAFSGVVSGHRICQRSISTSPPTDSPGAVRKKIRSPLEGREVAVIPRVPHLLQYVSSGMYYARVVSGGKLFRVSPNTRAFTPAKPRLADFLQDLSRNVVPLVGENAGCTSKRIPAQQRPNFRPMKNEATKTTKPNKSTDAQLLDLLKRVLPKATHDPKLAGQIYQAIELELKSKARATAFEKFCDKVELPDLDPKTVEAVQRQFAAAFGDGDITIQSNRKEQTLTVEVMLSDGNQFSSEIKVRELAPEATDEQEITFKFVPFPVCLPGDDELVWLLAKRENMTADEAGIALTKMEEDFWASKTGQKLLRDRVERCFPEFIARAPAGMLSEVGLKRHYKTPEPVKMLRRSAPTVKAKTLASTIARSSRSTR
jgi:hypothetical protein